jgi:hypothetical protein
MVVYKEKLTAFPLINTLVQQYVPQFDELVAKEGKLVDAQKKNPYTALIVDADKLNDRLALGIKGTIAVAMKHYDSKIVAAAVRLNDRLKAFGKIESKSYEEEAAAISILIADLQSSVFSTDVTIVGLTGWVTQLATSVENFKNLLQLRNESIAPDLGKENLKTVRRQIEVVYHKMTNRINAAAELDETGQYATFIQQLNAGIHYFNEHTHINAKKDLGESDYTVIDQIGVQTYTGMEITPLPVVSYHEKEKAPVQLVFTKDFSLTFKNNRNPGMATLTVHGKGAYKGKKSTTFNIIRAKN